MIPSPLYAIGVMSGSSLDGVDLVLVHFFSSSTQTLGWRIVKAETQSYPEEWLERLRKLSDFSLADFFHVDFAYSQLLGRVIRDFLGAVTESVSVVGVHGHTFLHLPEKGYSIQLGRGEVIASIIGIPVVTDFRTRLIALGGEGAPLVPHAESMLFPAYDAFLNLGGIANLSLHSSGIAFDFHACNQILNRLANAYDPNLAFDPEGSLGRHGTFSPSFFQFLQTWDYLRLPPPKSLSNEMVQKWCQQILEYPDVPIPDKIHTFVHHLTEELAQVLSRYRIRNTALLVTGGGAFNTILVECMREKLSPLSITVEVPDPTLVKYKEALCFAYFAMCVYYKIPWTLSNFTPQRRRECAGAYHHVC